MKFELKKLPKDTVMPKQTRSAYNCYCAKWLSALKKEFPDKSATEIMKLTSEKFKNLTEAAKKPYEAESAKDRVRYENEIDQLRTHGFFVNKDGVRSCDLKKKVSRNSKTEKDNGEAEKANKLAVAESKKRDKLVDDKAKALFMEFYISRVKVDSSLTPAH